MKTAIALVLAASFATSGAYAQTVAAPVSAPTQAVGGVLPGSGLSAVGAAVGIGAAIIVVGAAIAIGSDNDDSTNGTSGQNSDD